MNRALACRLGRDERGSTILEFALVVPMLFTLIFGLMEVSYALFSFQQVQAVANDTARCMAISSKLCATGAATYAVNVSGPAHAVSGLTAAMVKSNAAAICGGQSNMTQITIAYPLSTALPLNFIPSFMSDTVTGIGCFPNI